VAVFDGAVLVQFDAMQNPDTVPAFPMELVCMEEIHAEADDIKLWGFFDSRAKLDAYVAWMDSPAKSALVKLVPKKPAPVPPWLAACARRRRRAIEGGCQRQAGALELRDDREEETCMMDVAALRHAVKARMQHSRCAYLASAAAISCEALYLFALDGARLSDGVLKTLKRALDATADGPSTSRRRAVEAAAGRRGAI
jgi:hypothetical protein